MTTQKTQLTSVELARKAAVETADMGPEAVGDFLRREDLGDHVYDFRFDSGLKGYEHWEWAVTLFHDTGLDQWTVNQAALLPTKRSLVAPKWIPFSDRLPGGSDEEVGKDLEPGLDAGEGGQQQRDRDGNLLDPADSDEDIAEAINRFYLSRRLVPSPKGLQDTAQRWADARSRIHSRGKGVTDAFVVPLEGFLGRFYGVCTNRHCRFDGKVVPLNHTCADPAENDDDLYKDLWPENNPLVDSEHIDVFDDDNSEADESEEDDVQDEEEGRESDEEEDPTLVSDPRHHKVIENIEDMSVPDMSDDGNSQDESLLQGTNASDPRAARAIQEGFTRVRRRRRRH